MSATLKYAFRDSRAGAGAPKRLQAGSALPAPEKVPRVARLLALAHKFQGMLDSGEVESMADLARLGRVSRARITQIMDLLMLAPDVQEDLLHMSRVANGHTITQRELWSLCRSPIWAKHRAGWANHARNR